MIIGNKVFDNYTYVMAIINLTPDSFYKDSRTTLDGALFAAEKAVKDGAAIIDLGVQSTRPDYTEVPAEEEILRLGDAVEKIKSNLGVPVSVDTYFSWTARYALDAGADMINDVWGLTHDKDMAQTIAAHGASVCIMHNAKKQLSGDIMPQIQRFLQNSLHIALNAGIPREKICLDGGIGFAKDAAQSALLLARYAELKTLGYPLLLGASRKSLFGGRAEDRLTQTVAATVGAAMQGVAFVRVHDVKENAEAIKRVYGY